VDFGRFLGITFGIVALWAVLLLFLWLARPKGVPARELIRIVPDVLRLIRAIIVDQAAPIDVRVVLVGLLAWIISPIDLIPEFIPVLGPVDDAIVAVVAMRYVRSRLGTAELLRRWPGSDEGFALLTRVIGSSAP
jgi:uncharacterized membrane protein YkvA (DUF1232 family)